MYFKEKLDFENFAKEGVHRSKAKNSSSKPRTKLLPYKQKREILKNVKKLKSSDTFVNEVFCFETVQRRKEL